MTRPAPIRSTTASVICRTTSVDRARTERTLDVPRDASFKPSIRLAARAWSTGPSPHSSAAASTVTNVNAATVGSIDTSLSRGMSSGASETMADGDPAGGDQADEAAGDGDQEAFGGPEPSERAARGAERETDGVFAAPHGGAGEHQAGHVRARDQQQHADRAEQPPQRVTDGTEHVIEQRRDDGDGRSAPGGSAAGAGPVRREASLG